VRQFVGSTCSDRIALRSDLIAALEKLRHAQSHKKCAEICYEQPCMVRKYDEALCMNR
jgi:hypothetical protein